MEALLAEGDVLPPLPWPWVIALCGALGGAIAVMWKRDITREQDRTAREKEFATQARSDGMENARALATAAETMKLLAAKIEESDRQRAAIGDDLREAIERCQRP